jgi:hypothetical protein
MGANRTERSGASYYGIADGKFTLRMKKEDFPENADSNIYRHRSGNMNGTDWEVYEEVFDSLSGQLKDISFQEPSYEGGGKHFRVTLEDGNETLIVNIKFDTGNRLDTYGVDFIGRLLSLDPDEIYNEDVILWPYKIERDDKPGKFNIGISLRVGVDELKFKSAFSKEGRLAKHLPDAVKTVKRGKDVWDYSGREEKIYEFAERFVKGFTELASADQLGTATKEAVAKEVEAEEPVLADDDLPF